MTNFICVVTFLLHLCTNVLGDIYINGVATPNRVNNVSDIYLRFYNGSTVDYFVQFPLSQASSLFNIDGFQPNNLTVFYAHGFTENADRESVKTMASAYLDTKPGTNFILIDWSNMAGGNYITNAAPNTMPVGTAVAGQISALINGGLPLSKIHLIGHSLGSHVVGKIARELKNTYQMTFKRVTGLDPAFPLFYPDGLNTEHIRASDAEFVDVIHTDSGGYGAPVSTGTVDFWPNNGRAVQPGCTIELPLTNQSYCSHWRSWRYYAESVRTPAAFYASPANTYLQFMLNPNPTAGMIYLGYSCPSTATGNFYLTTNSASPYGKGLAGLQ